MTWEEITKGDGSVVVEIVPRQYMTYNDCQALPNLQPLPDGSNMWVARVGLASRAGSDRARLPRERLTI